MSLVSCCCLTTPELYTDILNNYGEYLDTRIRTSRMFLDSHTTQQATTCVLHEHPEHLRSIFETKVLSFDEEKDGKESFTRQQESTHIKRSISS